MKCCYVILIGVVTKNFLTRGEAEVYSLFNRAITVHNCRYKECDDGICRLQTVRFESLHLSQLMNEQEGAGNTEMQAGDSPQDCIDSPATSGGSPESNIEGSPFLNRGDHPGELNYQELLQEWNESNSSTQDRRHNGGGPIRSRVMGRVSEAHPYERSESPELDLPQTLLDLQDAAIRLANGQN